MEKRKHLECISKISDVVSRTMFVLLFQFEASISTVLDNRSFQIIAVIFYACGVLSFVKDEPLEDWKKLPKGTFGILNQSGIIFIIMAIMGCGGMLETYEMTESWLMILNSLVLLGLVWISKIIETDIGKFSYISMIIFLFLLILLVRLDYSSISIVVLSALPVMILNYIYKKCFYKDKSDM